MDTMEERICNLEDRSIKEKEQKLNRISMTFKILRHIHLVCMISYDMIYNTQEGKKNKLM